MGQSERGRKNEINYHHHPVASRVIAVKATSVPGFGGPEKKE